MRKQTDNPLHNIRENMARLMIVRGFVHRGGEKDGEPNHRPLAKRAGVDPKTVGNLLNPEWNKAPTLRIITSIAHALGVSTWQLCMPNLPTSKDVNSLLRGGIDDDTYQLAAIYQIMQPDARKRARAVLEFVTTHPDAVSTSDLLRAARR